MKSTAGNSSTGKWFSLIVIAATGVVASLPFRNPNKNPSQSNADTGVSLRISSDAEDSPNKAPRPVSTPRINGASLQQPGLSVEDRAPVDRTIPSFRDSNRSSSVEPIRQPSWENQDYPSYPSNATGENAPPPPFVTSSDQPQNDVEESSQTDNGLVDDETFGNDVAGTGASQSEYDGSRYGNDEGDSAIVVAENGPDANPDSRYSETATSTNDVARNDDDSTEPDGPSNSDNDNSDNDNSDVYSHTDVYGNGDIYSDTDGSVDAEEATTQTGPDNRYGHAQKQEPSDAENENDDVLPPPKSNELASEDTLPAPANTRESYDDLPPPRPRLTISEDRLPAPRQRSNDSRVADDGFRPVGGRTVGSSDAPRAEDDGIIGPPVTRLVRLGPPDSKSKTIRAPQFHVVRDGDSIDGLAETYWGDKSRWRAIFSANRHVIDDPELLPIGVKLRIPNDDFYQTLRRK